MGSSDTGLNNDDDSATVSDESNTETDSDMRTETDEECQSSHPPSVFVNDEKVLAFHSGQYYEAKGWNKTWDEWVGTDRLLKHTEENVQKQKVLKERLEMEMKTKAVQAPQMKLKNSGVSRGRKRKNDNLNKEKDLVPLEKLVNLQIPPTLKKQLVDDCEFITHQSKVIIVTVHSWFLRCKYFVILLVYTTVTFLCVSLAANLFPFSFIIFTMPVLLISLFSCN
ncbi:hypothetical protein NC652_032280 [Populus alba x Populus x berolinensis]|nr:hypothetical protein NC652_032280 [Populus alba x Populus x berolinensis]